MKRKWFSLVASSCLVFTVTDFGIAQNFSGAVRELVQSEIQKRTSEFLDFYQDLHAHPELSFMEEKTSAQVAEKLRKAGYVVTTGIGKYGVVGVLHNGGGPTVLLRTDMDGLPVKEQT